MENEKWNRADPAPGCMVMSQGGVPRANNGTPVCPDCGSRDIDETDDGEHICGECGWASESPEMWRAILADGTLGEWRGDKSAALADTWASFDADIAEEGPRNG